jgi:hypothetical protein
MKIRPSVLATPLCLLYLAAPTTAQQDLHVTVLAGLSSATHTGNGADQLILTRRNGLVAGAGLSTGLTPALDLGLEALYTSKGSVDDLGDRVEVDYLELPLLLTFSVPLGDALPARPMLMAGPTLAIKLRARWVEEGVSYGEDELEQKFSGTDLGLALGAGVGVPLGRGEVRVLGRFVAGFRDVFSERGSVPPDVKNQSLQAMLGYAIPIGTHRR